MKNKAVVFIKPHAMTEKTIQFTEDFLEKNGIHLTARGVLTAEEIDTGRIIDRHYFAIAHTAVELKPAEYDISDEARMRFRDAFGIDWDTALSEKKLLNAAEFMTRHGLKTGTEIQEAWSTGIQAKLGPGFYAGKIQDRDLYIINGFYPAMREKFTAAGGKVGWYAVEFDPEISSWKEFRSTIIGATDPAKAAPGSLRHEILLKYRELGQTVEPGMSANGVHASAGPLEGLKELEVWTGADIREQEFTKALTAGGMTEKRLRELLMNGTVTVHGKTGPAFDLTEDMNADEVVRLLHS